ncbi:MAG TPA: MATE family efflux transporter [Bacteroidales bacterium]|nr:MATE family efflux transporter [Bacteroidales bacterium]
MNTQRLLQKSKRFMQLVGESIRGTEYDFTKIRLGKAILILSVPMILEMLMESVFAIADIWFVSSLGDEAIATVGVTESLNTIIYAIGFGLSTAITALVSRRIGEKQPEKAARSAGQAMSLAVIISAVIAVPTALHAREILQLMGLSARMAAEYSSYTAIILGSNTIVMLLFVNNAIFRSAGDAAISMKVLWLANLLNIILDPCLIFGLGPFPELGIKGAAIATSTGRGVAVLWQLILLFRGNGRIKIRTSYLVPSSGKILTLLNLAWSAVLQNLIGTASWLALMRIMSQFGSEVLAGYTIAIRVIMFCLLPSWGISNAASTLTGQNLGAGRPDRAEKAVWTTGLVNVIMLGVISLLLILVPEFFIRLFTDQPGILQPGAGGLRIVGYGMVAYGLGMVMHQAFNGAGDTRTPLVLNLISFWVIEIPLAWWLAIHLDMKEMGVFYAILIAESTLTLLGVWMFRRGRWKGKLI